MVVYVVTNRINGKQYVGQTIQPIRKRWLKHLSDANRGSQRPLSRAIRKYGQNNFDISIKARVSSPNALEWLNTLEPLFIAAQKTLVPDGYNLDSGGKNTRRHPLTKLKIGIAAHNASPETRAKIGAGAKYWSGKRRSIEDREKMRVAHIGRKHSAVTKAKMSDAKKGRKMPESFRDACCRAWINRKSKKAVY